MAKLRLQITKGDQIRYVSHLDFAGTIERAVRRAKLPAAYSEGFNPHMKLAFASALAVGVTSRAEYLDLELTDQTDLTRASTSLSAQLPEGIELVAAKYVDQRSQALMAVVNQAVYEITVTLKPGASLEMAAASLASFNQEVEVIYVKQSPKGRREIDIKEYLLGPIAIKPAADNPQQAQLDLSIKITPTGSVKPVEVLAALADSFNLPIDKDSALITRTGLFVSDGRARRSPLDI